MSTEMERLDKHRREVRTRSGLTSYVDTGGSDRPALFVHGLATSSYLWRHVIAQLEGSHPEWLHTLSLTNCEAHDNLPPRALAPMVLLARLHLMARIMPRLLLSDISRGRQRMYGAGYEDIENLPLDIARTLMEPLIGPPSRPGRTIAS